MSRKALAWTVIPLCLILITLGMKLPNLASLHTPPKPRPRAVIETSSKSYEDATTQNVGAVELCDNVPTVTPPQVFRSRFHRGSCQFSSTTPPWTGARAPPILS